jgi:GNAT superfamily N-acetyltransferase
MPRRPDLVEVVPVTAGDERFDHVLGLAASVLAQDRYLTSEVPHAIESRVLAAFRDGTAVGFLRFLVQVIGAEEERPPLLRNGVALTEAYVEAFGVAPSERRHGVGSALQARVIEYARSVGCYQVRSRSPVSSSENHALKVAAGHAVSPSEQNDSYYFILKL